MSTSASLQCGTCRNIEFVRERDGAIKAVEFAKQAIVQYRRAVLRVRGRLSRRLMIEAYLCAKRYTTYNV